MLPRLAVPWQERQGWHGSQAGAVKSLLPGVPGLIAPRNSHLGDQVRLFGAAVSWWRWSTGRDAQAAVGARGRGGGASC